MAHGHHLGSAAHIPWVVVSVVLVVLAFRRLPVSYGAFAAAVLVVALASSNLDSFERYALGAFPLVVAASTLTVRRPVELAVLALVLGLAMVGLRHAGLPRHGRAVTRPVGRTPFDPDHRFPRSEGRATSLAPKRRRDVPAARAAASPAQGRWVDRTYARPRPCPDAWSGPGSWPAIQPDLDGAP